VHTFQFISIRNTAERGSRTLCAREQCHSRSTSRPARIRALSRVGSSHAQQCLEKLIILSRCRLLCRLEAARPSVGSAVRALRVQQCSSCARFTTRSVMSTQALQMTNCKKLESLHRMHRQLRASASESVRHCQPCKLKTAALPLSPQSCMARYRSVPTSLLHLTCTRSHGEQKRDSFPR
jgi:hypothetical protein